MTDESLARRLVYDYPYYADLVEPHGALTVDRRSHACFYYGMLATQARGKAGAIETQIIEYKVGDVAPDWNEERDLELARSVATIYQLESPEEFLAFRRQAWAQASAMGYFIDPKVFQVSPKKGKFIQ